jgi:hypothetical protein
MMPARFGTATPTSGVTIQRAMVSSTPEGLDADAIGAEYRLARTNAGPAMTGIAISLGRMLVCFPA